MFGKKKKQVSVRDLRIALKSQVVFSSQGVVILKPERKSFFKRFFRKSND